MYAPPPYLMELPPEGFLRYDEDRDDVYTRVLHCRPVTVVFEEDVRLGMGFTKEHVRDFIFSTWLLEWEIFGGFPYESYTIEIGDSSPYAATGEHGVGFELEASNPSDGPIAHGILHIWVGNDWRVMHPDGEPTDWGLLDGPASYYELRLAYRRESDPGEFYYDRFHELWQEYNTRVVGTVYDVPLTETAIYYSSTGDDYYSWLRYMKGPIVTYMLDYEIMSATNGQKSLDDLLRGLYYRYGMVPGTHLTTYDVLEVLAAEAGSHDIFEDFFRRYLFGNDNLNSWRNNLIAREGFVFLYHPPL